MLLARPSVEIGEAHRRAVLRSAGRSERCTSSVQKQHLLTGVRLFIDETAAKVLASRIRKTKTGYLWAMVQDDRLHGGADPPANVHTYMLGWGGMGVSKPLGNYHGILQVDGHCTDGLI